MRRQIQNQGGSILKEEERFFGVHLPTTRSLKIRYNIYPSYLSLEPLYLGVDDIMIHLQCEKKKVELRLAILHKGKEKISHTELLLGNEFIVPTILLVDHHYLFR